MKELQSEFRALVKVFAVTALLLCAASIGSAEAPPEQPPSGSMLGRDGVSVYAVYLKGDAPATVLDTGKAALQKSLPDWKLEERPSGSSPSYSIVHLSDVPGEYAPPPPEALKYSGRGLKKTDETDLQQSQHALVSIFAYPASCVPKCVEQSIRAMAAVRAATSGLLWDEATREVFSPEAWQTERIDSWSNGVPDIRRQITIHSYKSGSAVRAVTLGMSKFALPDLVVPAFDWSSASAAGSLINLTAQSLLQDTPVRDSALALDVERVTHPKFRTSLLASLLPNAAKTASIGVRWASPEDGDNDNRLLAIVAGSGAPEQQVEATSQFLAKLFGSSDKPVLVKRSDKLEAAKQRVADQLPKLKSEFNAGYPPGQFLLLKADFPISESRSEYMWVEVSTWADVVTGTLQNDPVEVLGLSAGQTVTIQQDKVIDYIINLPNGERLGYETKEAVGK